jgi:hypothetical protein
MHLNVPSMTYGAQIYPNRGCLSGKLRPAISGVGGRKARYHQLWGSNWRIRVIDDSIALPDTLIKLAQVIHWAKTSAPGPLFVSKCSPVFLLKGKFRPGEYFRACTLLAFPTAPPSRRSIARRCPHCSSPGRHLRHSQRHKPTPIPWPRCDPNVQRGQSQRGSFRGSASS